MSDVHAGALKKCSRLKPTNLDEKIIVLHFRFSEKLQFER